MYVVKVLHRPSDMLVEFYSGGSDSPDNKPLSRREAKVREMRGRCRVPRPGGLNGASVGTPRLRWTPGTPDRFDAKRKRPCFGLGEGTRTEVRIACKYDRRNFESKLFVH